MAGQMSSDHQKENGKKKDIMINHIIYIYILYLLLPDRQTNGQKIYTIDNYNL